jgi:predicted RNA binding protein YcfA (HicA-like mRNA interferase family)
MPNNVKNWTYKNVVTFLKENKFVLHHTRGSHFYFIGSYKNILRQVCVPYHGNVAIKPRTLKGIISQSGIPLENWLKNKI